MPFSARNSESFVSCPLQYAEAGRVSRLLAGHPLSEFAHSPEALDRLNRYAEKAWSLTPCQPADFPGGISGKVLLLDSAVTRKLAGWLGALLVLPRLRIVVRGEERRRLAEELPGIYPRCLQEAPLLRQWLDELARLPEQRLPELSGSACFQAGQALLAGLLSTLPEGLQQRWRLQFTEAEVTAATALAGIPMPSDTIWQRLLNLAGA